MFRRRPYLRRVFVVVVILLGLHSAAGIARAESSPAERIAAALEEFPIYVDPVLESELPEHARAELAAQIEGTGIDIYVVVSAVRPGDHWDGDTLSTLATVHERLGRDGVFLARHPAGHVVATEWPDGAYDARLATVRAALEEHASDSLETQLSRTIESITQGQVRETYERLYGESIEIGRDHDQLESGVRIDDALFGLLVFVVVGLAAAAPFFVVPRWRQRRRRFGPLLRRPQRDPFALSQQVFETARQANVDELRDKCAEEVEKLAALIQQVDLPGAGPQVRAEMQRALDAYYAATKVLDTDQGLADLAGALVLVDSGHDAVVAARASTLGYGVTPPAPVCFFNPLHGKSSIPVRWRRLGSRTSITAPACFRCAGAIRQRQEPDVLLDDSDGTPKPYFEVDPSRSVWSTTGYGALRQDLVDRIMRGDHDKTQPRL